MGEFVKRWEHPELKQLVGEASRALARLDARRLEELALSCWALNRDMRNSGPADRDELARQAREATPDLAVFARVLEATRCNLKVIDRLRELRAGRFEYSGGQAREWVRTENRHGDN